MLPSCTGIAYPPRTLGPLGQLVNPGHPTEVHFLAGIRVSTTITAVSTAMGMIEGFTLEEVVDRGMEEIGYMLFDKELIIKFSNIFSTGVSYGEAAAVEDAG